MKCATLLTLLLLPGLVVAAGENLPSYVLQLPESVKTVLVAETDTAMLHRYVADDAGSFTDEISRISIGQEGAGKQKSGDRRTPLGVYFVVDQLDTSGMHEKYGVTAFPLDYPNAWDRRQQRTGSGIWLHGVDHKNPDRPPLDTDGCLALRNEEILQLADVLEPLVTPVIVAREVVWATPDELEDMRLEFRLVLDIWKNSLARGDLKTYLSLYADDFGYLGMDKAEWSSYRLGVFGVRPLDGVIIDDVMLLADPEEPNLYLSRFTQVLQTNNGPVTTTKRLYWRRHDGSRWEIVSEYSG